VWGKLKCEGEKRKKGNAVSTYGGGGGGQKREEGQFRSRFKKNAYFRIGGGKKNDHSSNLLTAQ